MSNKWNLISVSHHINFRKYTLKALLDIRINFSPSGFGISGNQIVHLVHKIRNESLEMIISLQLVINNDE